jgi:L-lactate dehydrogenase complex protein LldG
MVGKVQAELMNAREDILERIRAANAGVEPPSVERSYRRRLDPACSTAELLDLLAERLLDYRAAVRRCRPDAIGGTVGELLGGAAPVLAAPGIPRDWCPTAEPDRIELGAHELDRYAAVVTAAAVACAETGTIALDASPDQGRRAITLIPDLHICVVQAEQVVALVPEMLSRLVADRPTTFISGPSATSDIELERVEGVHGPRTLCVVLVEPD